MKKVMDHNKAWKKRQKEARVHNAVTHTNVRQQLETLLIMPDTTREDANDSQGVSELCFRAR